MNIAAIAAVEDPVKRIVMFMFTLAACEDVEQITNRSACEAEVTYEDGSPAPEYEEEACQLIDDNQPMEAEVCSTTPKGSKICCWEGKDGKPHCIAYLAIPRL